MELSGLHHGDCVEVMAAMDAASVDAIVTDPPYGLEFMGKEWDRLGAGLESTAGDDDPFALQRGGSLPFGAGGRRVRYGTDARTMQDWHQRWATEALRIAKPGAYLLAFGGTRTYHRLACAIEDAGWIIRDCLVWAYAQGFPKSRALLKPAWEPIVMARKPGPLRELAIDECRIGMADDDPTREWGEKYGGGKRRSDGEDYEKTKVYGDSSPLGKITGTVHAAGRWPANVILTDPIFDGDVDGVVGGGEAGGGYGVRGGGAVPVGSVADQTVGAYGMKQTGEIVGYGDTGTYSRFFLVSKAARSDREPNDYGRHVGGLEGVVAGNGMQGGIKVRECRQCGSRSKNVELGADWPACAHGDWEWKDAPNNPRANVHPTVKPIELMRHLVRLVMPAGGTVLDPFLGSGTTAIAAEMEGFAWIGIEREAEYVAIAEARLAGVQRGMGLSA